VGEDALRLDVIAAILGEDKRPASRFNRPQAFEYRNARHDTTAEGDELRDPVH
jgi:hypothetical protein